MVPMAAWSGPGVRNPRGLVSIPADTSGNCYRLVPGGGKGSHEKWRGQDGRMFPVPRKDPVGRGVFDAFLDHFGIDKREYIERDGRDRDALAHDFDVRQSTGEFVLAMKGVPSRLS